MIALALISISIVNACGSGADSGSSVDDTWFSQHDTHVSGIVTVTADDDAVGRFIYVDVEFLDADGESIATAQRPAIVDWEKQRFALPVEADTTGGHVASMRTTLRTSGEKIGDSGPQIDPVEAYSITDDGPTTHTASFALHQLPDETQTGVTTLDLGVACFDKGGDLIGGTAENPKIPETGGLLQVKAHVTTDSRPDSCRAFPAHL